MTLLLPALFALGAWLAGLGVVVLHGRLPRAIFGWVFALTTLGAIAALVGLALLRDDASVPGAAAALGCGVALWAWQELASVAPGRPRRSGHGVTTSVAQELTWVLPALGAAALVGDGANQAGLWAFLTLWASHVAARLNALAAAHARSGGPLLRPPWFATGLPSAQLLSAVFPLTVSATTAAATLLAAAALEGQATAGATAGAAMLAGLLAASAAGQWSQVLRLTPLLRAALARAGWELGSARQPGEQAPAWLSDRPTG